MSIQDEIPRSRINLRYRTNINGNTELLELPFRLLILGDLSQGSSVDREVDLESRRLRSLDGKNLDSVMENMRMSVSFSVENHIDPKAEERLEVNLPIRDRRSLSPDQVAQNVPKVRALLLLRRLLLEMQSNIDNRKDLRKLIHELFGNAEKLQGLRQALSPYASYRLPSAKGLAAPSASKPAAETK